MIVDFFQGEVEYNSASTYIMYDIGTIILLHSPFSLYTYIELNVIEIYFSHANTWFEIF